MIKAVLRRPIEPEMDLSMSECDIADLVIEVVDGFRPIADAKDQTVVCTTPNKSISLYADRDRLAQVMTNLLTNASKYSPRGTPIEITTRRWKDRIYFSVTDQGFGISEEDQKSLFTLFFRVDNEDTRSEPGTGIGLYIARSVVDLHDGKIWVKSSPGQGTTVSFFVPGVTSGVVTPEEQPSDHNVIPWSRLDDLPHQAAS